MVKLTILFTILISSNLAAEEFCSTNETPEATQTLLDLNCKLLAKNSCTHRNNDEQTLTTQITKIFENSENPEIRSNVIRNWKHFAGHPLTRLFDYDPKDKTEDNQAVATHLLDWMTNNGKAQGLDREGLKQSIIKKYAQFGETNDCMPVIKHRYIISPFPFDKEFKDKDDYLAYVSDPKYIKEKDEHFKNYNAKTLDSGVYCEAGSRDDAKRAKVAQVIQPCTGNITGHFPDNVWTTSSLQTNQDPEAKKLIACIQDRLEVQKAKIHHISIQASASALNNTGAAAEQFCGKGFLELSRARAQNAKDKILPAIFGINPEYLSKVDPLSFSGVNGDGTSGPCPYTMVNGIEVLKDKYKTAAGKKELNNNKFVKIHVTFEDHTKPVTSPYMYSPSFRCRQIHFECASR